jgi:hypothetical protein
MIDADDTKRNPAWHNYEPARDTEGLAMPDSALRNGLRR